MRHLGRHRERDRTAACAEVDGDGGIGDDGPESVDRELGDHLGLGARDEDAGADGQFHRPEGGASGEVLQGLARAAAVDEGREGEGCRLGHAVSADRRGLHAAPRGIHHVGDEQFGIHLGVGDARAAEAGDGLADDVGDRGGEGGGGRDGLRHDGSPAYSGAVSARGARAPDAHAGAGRVVKRRHTGRRVGGLA